MSAISLGFDLGQPARRFEIEERVRAAYLDDGIAQYWPDQFVDAHLGTLDEVLEALAELVNEGKLLALVQARCPNGHICWQGDRSAFAKLVRAPHFHCRGCERGFERDDLHFSVLFRINPSWRDVMGIEREKKTLVRG